MQHLKSHGGEEELGFDHCLKPKGLWGLAIAWRKSCIVKPEKSSDAQVEVGVKNGKKERSTWALYEKERGTKRWDMHIMYVWP